MDDFSVACLQIHVDDDDPAANVAAVTGMMRGAAHQPNVYVLPELWTRTYVPGMETMPHEASEGALSAIREACADLGVFAVVGNIPWMTTDGLRSRLWVVNDAGEAYACYDKVHLFSRGGEDRIFRAGSSPGMFDIGGIPCAAVTCYDIRFPEFSRCLALAGARMIFVCAQWPSSRGNIWSTLNRGMAANNQLYVVSCNCTGVSSGVAFFGHSTVVSPWGDTIAEAGDEAGVLSASFKLREVEKCRKNIPIMQDRRPEMYRFIQDG